MPRVVWSGRVRQVSAAMRSRRGASTRTVVRSSAACAALVPRDVMRWAFQGLRGTRAASWTGTRLLSRARSTRTSGTAASAAPVHGRRMPQGRSGVRRAPTVQDVRQARAVRERFVRVGRSVARSVRRCAAPVPQHRNRCHQDGHCRWHTTGAAQHGTGAAANRLGGDAHGSWSLPSHSRLGGDGEGAPAGGSAGGSKTELNSHSRYAPQCHSTSVASTEHGVTSSAQPVSDAYRCTGCAIATLTLVGCTAAREQRGSTTTRTRAT